MNRIHRLTQIGFGLLLVLSLGAAPWGDGPFRWWPLARGTFAPGALTLLAPLVAAGWLLPYALDGDRRAGWRWGPRAVTLPLLGLTVWGLLRLGWRTPEAAALFGGGLLVAWLVYLFVLNERPSLALPLAVVVVVQAGVALVQFGLQRDLGLTWLGELPLVPLREGISVLQARGQPWLRAYGLTDHPNYLGALLAALLLVLLPAYGRSHGCRRWAWTVVGTVGIAGLLASFSRAAWLGFASGLTWSAATAWLSRFRKGARQMETAVPRIARGALPLLAVLLLLTAYGDLALSRFVALDSTLEATSITERVRDGALALRVFADAPWAGVGPGAYLAAAQRLDAAAGQVHNVPLLAAAELGLPGLLLVLALFAGPFWAAWRRGAILRAPGALAPWVALVIISLFDTTLWFASSWQTAVLFGLVAGTGAVMR